jgi:hypothetical protein
MDGDQLHAMGHRRRNPHGRHDGWQCAGLQQGGRHPDPREVPRFPDTQTGAEGRAVHIDSIKPELKAPMISALETRTS